MLVDMEIVRFKGKIVALAERDLKKREKKQAGDRGVGRLCGFSTEYINEYKWYNW